MPPPDNPEADFKKSVAKIDRALAPLDVVELYRELDRNRNGLSMSEINAGHQDDAKLHDPDALGHKDDRAISLSILHNKGVNELFRALDPNSNNVITAKALEKFSQTIPTYLALKLINGNTAIKRYLDENHDGKFQKDEIIKVHGQLENGATKQALKMVLDKYDAMARGKGYIPSDSLSPEVNAMLANFSLTDSSTKDLTDNSLGQAVKEIENQMSPEERRLADSIFALANAVRHKLDHATYSIKSNERTDTDDEAVLQSDIGDCYGLGPLVSFMHRDREGFDEFFKLNKQTGEVQILGNEHTPNNFPIISVIPNRADLATYASSRGNPFPINAAEKVLGEYARTFPEDWAKIINVTPEPAINVNDNPPPSAYLDGGGDPAGVLTYLTTDPLTHERKYGEYASFWVQGFKDADELATALKNLPEKAPLAVTFPVEWLRTGTVKSPQNYNFTGNSGTGGDGVIGRSDKDEKSERKAERENEKDKRNLDDIRDQKPSLDMRWDNIPNQKKTFDIEPGPKPHPGPIPPHPVPRDPHSETHAVAVLNYHPETRTFDFYNSWGQRFSRTVEELRQIPGVIIHMPLNLYKKPDSNQH